MCTLLKHRSVILAEQDTKIGKPYPLPCANSRLPGVGPGEYEECEDRYKEKSQFEDLVDGKNKDGIRGTVHLIMKYTPGAVGVINIEEYI